MADEPNRIADAASIAFTEADIEQAPSTESPDEIHTAGCGAGKTGVVWTNGKDRWMWVDKAGGVDRTYATGAIVDFTAVDVRLTFYDVMESTNINIPGHVHRLEKSVQVVLPLSAIRSFATALGDLVNNHQAWLTAEEEFAKLGSSIPSDSAVSQIPNLKGVQ